MAAANFLWLHFQNTRSSIQSFFFRSVRSSRLEQESCCPKIMVVSPEIHGHVARRSGGIYMLMHQSQTTVVTDNGA